MLTSRTVAVLATVGVLLAGIVAGTKAAETASGQPHRGGEPLEGFSIVVTTAGSGIAATCEEGCAWQTLSAEYPEDQYDISSAGIQPAGTDPSDDEESTFSFRLARNVAEGGIRARCNHGCVWTSLSGTYPAGTYRITRHGIGPVYGFVR